MTRAVLTTCCVALIASSIPSGAQIFGDLYWKIRSSAPGMLSDPTLARWMMRLPADGASRGAGGEAALLEGRSAKAAAPLGGTRDAVLGSDRCQLAKSEGQDLGSASKPEKGVAVWSRLRGRTASGEAADPAAFTAGHRTLPFGTRVRIVNQVNGESVVVRINDRGPRRHRYLVNLSEAGAKAIGVSGTAPVTLNVERSATVAQKPEGSGRPAPEGRSAATSLSPAAGERSKPQDRLRHGRDQRPVTDHRPQTRLRFAALNHDRGENVVGTGKRARLHPTYDPAEFIAGTVGDQAGYFLGPYDE